MNASPQIRITVRNAQRKLAVDFAELQRFADDAWKEAWQKFPERRKHLHGVDEIIAVLVSDRRIAELHRRFMNITGATDVLTFQHGEIFISVETAAANAARFGTTADAEVRLYFVHGILHLLGFDDTTARAARLMEKMQTQIFRVASGR